MQASQTTANAGQLGDRLALFVCRAIRPLTDGRNVGELHIATEGRWEGHAQGPFEFTAATFDEMIARFEAQSNPMGIDYEHRTFSKTAPDSTAAGWIQKLEKRQGPNGWELWAVTEWTEPAAAKIRAREYAFCSPAFTFEGQDRKTGEAHGPSLTNVALTNLPFLDGQKPIQLSWLAALPAAKKPEPEDEAAKAAPAAPPPAKADAPPPADPAAAAQVEGDPSAIPPEVSPEADQARALNEQLTAAIDQMCATAGLDRAAVVELLATMADEVGGQMRDRAERDGTQAEERKMSAVTDQEKADAEKLAQIEARAKEQDVVLLTARLDAVEADNKARDAREKAAKDAADKARIDGMVKCGALAEDERDGATWLLSTNEQKFEEIYKHRKGLGKAVPIGESQAGHEVPVVVVDPGKGTEAELREIDRPYFNGLLCSGVAKPVALKRTFEARKRIDAEAVRFGLEVR